MKVRTSVLRGFALLALSSLTFAACDESTTPPAPPAPTVTVAPSTVTLQMGQSATLSAAVSGSANQNVTWRSGNTAVANVSAAGVVTTVAPGTTGIIAISQADTTARAVASVTVNPAQTVPVTLTLVPEQAQVQVNSTVTLVGVVGGPAGVSQTVNYTSSDTTIATVTPTGGVVRGVRAGPATITARAAADANVVRTANITVTAGPVTPPVTISITPTTATTGVGDSVRFVANVQGSTNTAVTWTSTNTAVVRVNAQGYAVGVAPGTAVITAASAANPAVTVNATVIVTAATPPPPPPSISIASVLLPNGTPINPLNVAGQINATVNVSAVPANNVRSVALELVNPQGNVVEVCRQDFTPALGTTQSVATINCPINTAAIDEMGRAVFLNQNYQLRAVAFDSLVGGRFATPAGNEVARAVFCPQGQTEQCVLRFNNVNFLSTLMVGGPNFANDPLGRRWYDSFTVTATPTIFTPGDASAILAVSAYRSSQIDPATGVITGAPINTQTINPTAPFGPQTVTFNASNLGAIEDSVFIVAQTTTAQSFVVNPILGNPNVFSNPGQWLRIDTWAPRVNMGTAFPNPYINNTVTFSLSPHCTVAGTPAGCQTTDMGVDRQNEAGNIVFDIVDAATGAVVAGGTNVTNAAGVAETMTNQAYVLRITIRDALGNQRVVFRGWDGVISSTRAGSARFGVDRTAPTMTGAAADAGGVARLTGRTNDPTPITFSFTFVDAATPPAGPSGFEPNPVTVQLRLFNAANPNGICVDPTTTIFTFGNCSAQVSGTAWIPQVDPTDANTQGYFVLTAWVTDAAGNVSTQYPFTTLQDYLPPTIGALTVQSVLNGGMPYTMSAQIGDNVDLGTAWAVIGYSNRDDLADAATYFIIQQKETLGTYGHIPLNTNVTFGELTIPSTIRSITVTDAATHRPTTTRYVAHVAEYVVRDVAGVQLSGGVNALGGNLCPLAVVPTDFAAAASTQNCTLRRANILPAYHFGNPSGNTLDWTTAGPLNNNAALGELSIFRMAPTDAGQGWPANTVDAVITGPFQTFQNPFPNGVRFYAVDSQGRAHLLTDAATVTVTDRTEEMRRVWRYTWGGSATLPAGTTGVFAMGIAANGDAIVTRVQTAPY
jgi:uncharacterized protein YjdB